MKTVILMYHRINAVQAETDHWANSVTLGRFEDQLSYLQHHYRTGRLEDVLAPASDGVRIAVSFDDGYFSTLALAKPLLHRFGIPATVFLATGYLGRPWFWWDRLEAAVHLIYQTGRAEPGSFAEHLTSLWHEMRDLLPEERREALRNLALRYGVAPETPEEDRPLSLAEAGQLASDLIAIGAHTVSHPWLPVISAPRMAREINLSKVQCAEIAGDAVSCFAYPFGGFDPGVRAEVAASGMRLACTTMAGAVDADTDRLALPRLAAGNWTGEELGEKLAGLLGTQAAARGGGLPPQPTVSVIVPLYNKAGYIAECLASIMAQTFTGFEIVIVDDGSSDGSGDIAEAWQRRHPGKIRVLRHPGGGNHGVGQSRNLAVLQARGRYIAFLDADDTWLPGKLAHDIAILEAHPAAAAVVSHTLYWWPNGAEPARVDDLGSMTDAIIPSPQLFETSYVTGTTESPCVCAVTVRREIATEIGWDPALFVAEDLKYFAELLFRFPVYLSSACLAEYRRVEDGAWSAAMADGTEKSAHVEFQRWLGRLKARAGGAGQAVPG